MELWYEYKRFMIIDLDTHQGNNYDNDHTDKEKFYIFDSDILTGDKSTKNAISMGIEGENNDVEFLAELETKLLVAFDTFKPTFVIYKAGTSCMEGESLGKFNLSPTGITLRDEMVFSQALNRKIPILMLLSNGFTKTCAPAIADSISNLVDKFDLFEDFIPSEKHWQARSLKKRQ